jgi:hypothetical protein
MEFKFGVITAQPTAHTIGPSHADVFEAEPSVFWQKTRPILSVDLAGVDPAFRGRAHFVYCQTDHLLEFDMQGDRYAFRRGYRLWRPTGPDKVLDPRSIVLDPEPLLHGDEEHDDDLHTIPLSVDGYLELHTIEADAFTSESAWTWRRAMRDTLRATRPELLLLPPRGKHGVRHDHAVDDLLFGGQPCWLQHPDTPVDPDGEPMAFVGQVRASVFSGEMDHCMIYLFHSPKHRIVTQVMQDT